MKFLHHFSNWFANYPKAETIIQKTMLNCKLHFKLDCCPENEVIIDNPIKQ
jgi:hypothetical protein